MHEIAEQNRWQEDWFNDGVAFHLSPLADSAADHLEFGTFPRDGEPAGLVVSVPSAEYLLALKLKAFRIMDPLRGETERLDILNLMRVVGISTAEDAISSTRSILPPERRFSREAAVPVEEHESHGSGRCAQIPSLRRLKDSGGSPRDVVLAEFVDTFDLAKTDEDRYASIEREPKLTGDSGLTPSWAQSPNIWPSSAGWGAFHTGSAIPRDVWIVPGLRRQTLRTPCANT